MGVDGQIVPAIAHENTLEIGVIQQQIAPL